MNFPSLFIISVSTARRLPCLLLRLVSRRRGLVFAFVEVLAGLVFSVFDGLVYGVLANYALLTIHDGFEIEELDRC